MFKHFLIATDGSPESWKALAQGLALARALSAKVTIATVTEPWTEAAYAILPTPSGVRNYEKAAAGNAAVILDRAKKVADQVGAQCVTRHIKDEQVSNRSIACVDGGCAACRRVYREFVHQALELRRIGRGKCACGRQSEV